MVFFLEKTHKVWMALSLFLSLIAAIKINPPKLSNSLLVALCMVCGISCFLAFNEMVKRMYFLFYERDKKKNPVAFTFFFCIALIFVTVYQLYLADVDTHVSRINLSCQLIFISLVGMISFLSMNFVTDYFGRGLDYRKSHEEINNFFSLVSQIRKKNYVFREDDVDELLETLKFLKDDLETNLRKEKKKMRPFLRGFIENITRLHGLFSSYTDIHGQSEIPRLVQSTKYPLFLHLPPGNSDSKISFSLIFASMSIPELKKKLTESKLEPLKISPLFVLIPDCKNYDELYRWKHKNHRVSIGNSNDSVLLDFLEETRKNKYQRRIVFDFYWILPSHFDCPDPFKSQLKAVAERQESISCFYSADCCKNEICEAGINALKDNPQPTISEIGNNQDEFRKSLLDSYYRVQTNPFVREGDEKFKEWKQNDQGH